MFSALVLSLFVLLSARADDPARLEPSLTAELAKAFAWTFQNRLRYTWVLPAGIKPGARRDLIIICHGTGLDYRWGSANYKPGQFRPSDIVLSVDGPSKADDGSRLFLGNEHDAEVFADFIVEVSKIFQTDRVYLYGHSQGSFFVCYFIGQHPELVDGAVAHASGVWTWTQYNADVARIPLAFMHGTNDPVVPYGQSVGGRDWYREQGHRAVQLRRLPGYNHWPNGDRASECLEWCIGMRTEDPARALAAAREMLRPKGTDEYGYEIAPWFSGARDVLRRLEGAGPRAFDAAALEKAGPGALAEAKALAQKIEAAGVAQVERLREQIKSRDDLKLDGRPWLGHLLALREDFRGVDAVEAFLKELDFDQMAKEQDKASSEFQAIWWDRGTPAEKFAAATATLPRCFLLDTLPSGMGAQLEAWFKAAEANHLGPDAGRSYAAVAQWRSAMAEGLKEYREVWKAWKP